MKYYYTDPLAAAWMAKHFGMRFIWKGVDLDDMPDPDLDDQLADVTNRFAEAYYIHPDSLHLLEPQAGDIKMIAHKKATCRRQDEFADALAEALGAPPDMDVKIIYRNGLPFMWPETEEQANEH